ncbi:carotenoid ester lipase precursor [Lactarius sanguifluus]|nr:carotenoid ester lipase precursor [Lactarius sanguifluus]
MASLRVRLFAICAAAATVLAATPPITSSCPIVKLDRGTFVGTRANGTNRFLGHPLRATTVLVGDLRFRLPKALGAYVGKHNASAFGLSCPQQAVSLALPDGLPPPTLQYLSSIGTRHNKFQQAKIVRMQSGKLRLTLNVIAPAGVKPGSKLPVVVWIYGGAFEVGSTVFDFNYITYVTLVLFSALAAFGFLASKEVKNAKVGNLGLWDQRLALHWVQKYIHAFGGDPSKVTIWGESAGASLGITPDVGKRWQIYREYTQFLSELCRVKNIMTSSLHALIARALDDTLACLRAAPYEELKAAMDDTPSILSFQSVALAWQPRADGVFLTDHPQKLVQQGKVARIPFVAGECDDEGTLFSLSQTNITTDADLRAYLAEFMLINVTAAQMDQVLTLYPEDVTQGSPFDTGNENALTPEFKRIASFLGDFVFQAPRRFLLKNVSGKQNTWSYLTKRLKSLPILGSAHASDIAIIYGGQDLTDYLIHFATNLNPNGGSSPQWPRYTTSSPQLADTPRWPSPCKHNARHVPR